MKKNIYKSFFLIALTVAVVACGGGKKDKKAELAALKKELATTQAKIKVLEEEVMKADTTKKDDSKLVLLTTVSLTDFNHYIDVQGNVEAEDNALVATKQPGITITKIYVHAGDAVTAGQTLAEGDANAMYAQIEQMKVQLGLATTAYERQKNLWEQKVGTEFQYLQAKTQKEALEKSIAAMYSQTQYSKIIAPFSGIVDEVKIKEGEMSSPGFSGIRVVNTSKLKVRANVADMYINKVNKGNKVKIVVPDMKDEIEATVTHSGSVVNPTSRTFIVEVATNNQMLKPNMLTTLKINDATQKNVILLNENIIQQSETGPFVMIAKREGVKVTAHKAPIKTGLSYNGKIIVMDGLKVGDEIIATGYGDLVEGQEIKL
ncbi:MAG: efflux RND transporter periplasmic adaptor subunit [Bacteroidetes bacterium]|nr:efflux RND transporter periplasmic adaptor subunit [Bacteroidota bacterium]